MGNVLGIDLGTTNSCAAIYRDGRAEILLDDNGDRTIPSVVARSVSGQWLVGVAAKRQAVTNPFNTIYGIKRLIGRKFDSSAVAAVRRTVPYPIVAGENGDAWVRLAGQVCSPQEISAHILRHVRQMAERRLGETVTEAVITVPAYFDDAQRQATKDAGEIAGLRLRAIVNEPTAAALAYGNQKHLSGSTIAVFDLGGGTFDISILRIEDGVYEVLATNGDTFLGGDDFDRLVIDALVAQCHQRFHVDLRTNPTALQRLKEAAETVKIDLSSQTSADFHLPFLADGPQGPIHFESHVMRDWFEQLSAPIIARLDEPCRRALADACLPAKRIESIVLVGGMTRVPAVQEHVAAFFERRPDRDVNPDEVVALGAATHGAALAGKTEEILLLDVTPHSLGLKVDDGKFSVIVPRNTTVPTSASRTYKTLEDNQSYVQVEVYQGEAQTVGQARFLGKFTLGDLRPRPAGEVKIEVTFNISSDGILSVSAEDTETGKATSMAVDVGTGLSREQVTRLTRAMNPGVAQKPPFLDPITLVDDEPPAAVIVSRPASDAPRPTVQKTPSSIPAQRPSQPRPAVVPPAARFFEETPSSRARLANPPSSMPAVEPPQATFFEDPPAPTLPADPDAHAAGQPQPERPRRPTAVGYRYASERVRRVSGGYRAVTGKHRISSERTAAPAAPVDAVQREYERVRNADLFNALGLHWTDSPKRVDASIHEMRKKYGPGSPAANASPEFSGRRLELAEKAYERLATTAGRRAYRVDVLKVDVRGAADLLTQQVKLDIRRGEFSDAKDKLLAAIDLEPTAERRKLMAEISGPMR
jgi:molecular chaperone DnaK